MSMAALVDAGTIRARDVERMVRGVEALERTRDRIGASLEKLDEVGSAPLEEAHGELTSVASTLAECKGDLVDEISVVDEGLENLKSGLGRAELIDAARELALVRRAIIAGDTGEALYLLERALSDLDPAWRCYS